VLHLIDVSLSVGGEALFPPVALSVPNGTVVTVMGPSGSGKSSLLAFVAGTLPAAFRARGRVEVDGRDLTGLPPEARRIGLLFQDDLLFPHLTVGENLGFGLPARIKGAERAQAIARGLQEAELPDLGNRDPATLSGGQRARVALMRTLLAEPLALLLDEPFGRLDAALRDRIRSFVFEHARRRDLPVLLVTHDKADADAAGGPVVTLS
jgi:putative thiamine transport system ATP-binding protein